MAKGGALKAWQNAVKTAKPEDIIAGAKMYAKDKTRDPKFTAHPATWLNQQRWLDEPLTAEYKQEVRRVESYNPEIHGPNKDAVPMPEAVREFLKNALRK